MFFQRLAEYSERIDTPPSMYQKKLVKYLISLSREGRYLKTIPLDDKGISMNVPIVRRNGIQACLLADSAAYVLGLNPRDPEKAQEMHRKFKALTDHCAQMTKDPIVGAVLHFLDTLNIEKLDLPEPFDYIARITFEVDGVKPINLSEIQRYWAKASSSEDPNEQMMECLVCKEPRPPVEKLSITVSGVPGGQASGVALVSSYEPAFWSYGLLRSHNSPMCEDCATRCTNALNGLLGNKETHLYTGGLVYLFWAKEQESPFSWVSLFSESKPDEVQALFKSHWEGDKRATKNDLSPFYAAVLSGRSGRIVLHDWMQTTLAKAQENLENYFILQHLETTSGKERWFPLWALIKATIRPEIKQEAPPYVGQSLLHFALHGGKLPISLLTLVLGRLRAVHKSKPGESYVSAAQAALIKMALLSQEDTSWLKGITTERGHIMAQLEKECQSPAYLCGRLLAVLEALQYAALGEVNSTIVDSYYGTASTSPASAFAFLMRNAQPHLSRLRKQKPDTFDYFSRRFRQITEALIDNQYPATLTVIEQGIFNLGYWHQNGVEEKARFALNKQNGSKEGQQEEKTNGSK
jgi:CRISPR-associated protein Csd1